MAKTKYTEIPKDEAYTIVYPEYVEKKNKKEKVEESPSLEISHGISCDAPLLQDSIKEDVPDSGCSRHRRKSSETILRQCTGGTLRNRQRKSHSLPSSCSLNSISSDDSDIWQISAEDCATQLTLMDLPVFAKITPEEFMSCSWNKRNKLEITPNIVAFTRRFNQITFWAVQEVLKGTNCKSRAEILSHYIRICKKLYELNNFHSLFAIISALRSAPIYRLSKSWNCVSKKDKQTFEKLSAVFSDEENWKKLREHVESLKLPCIPYLGMFLTDIVYVNMAHPHSGGLETEQRRYKMNNILRVISHLQQSQYNHLVPLENVQKYLNSINYIEELQKFIEDDQYKLSCKLEPPSSSSSSNQQHSSCAAVAAAAAAGCANSKKSFPCSMVTETVANLNLSPAKLPYKVSNPAKNVGHRKCYSLGTNVLKSTPVCESHSRHLLDDSVIEDSGSHNLQSRISIIKPFSVKNDETSETVLLEGCLKKKIVFRHGCHPTVSSWHRYWVQVSPSSLVFYSPKCFKGATRNDFKKEPCKVWSVEGSIVTLGDNPDVFFFKDTHRSKLYKFRALNDSAALKWYRTLYNVAEGKREEINPSNLITF